MKRKTAACKNGAEFANCITRITDQCRTSSAEMRKITVNTIYGK